MTTWKNTRRQRDKPLIDRFTEKYVVNEETGCWEWQAFIDYGYGRFQFPGGSLAHRFSYQHFVGPIPDGLELDHLCRVRHCVNPAHLEPVSPRENVLRGESPASRHARQTHCVNGHEFTPENTYTADRSRRRRCRECVRLAHARKVAARRQVAL